MSQMSFSDFQCGGERKQICRERFLAEKDQVVPQAGLVALIEPHYPKAGVYLTRWRPCCAFTC